MGPLGEQRREGESLGVAELHLARLEPFDSREQRLAELAVDREAVGNAQELLVQRPEALLGDGGLHLGALRAIELAGAERRGARVLVLARLHLRAQVVELGLQPLEPPAPLLLDLLGADHALVD